MNYKDLARTFEIIAAKNPDNIVMDYATHDEYGFDLRYLKEPLTIEEVRELQANGGGGTITDNVATDQEVSEALNSIFGGGN